MSIELFEKLDEKYPFISVCRYAGQEYLGIIQNRDSNITTIYDFGDIVDPELKIDFLELGSTWWWESNRMIPINIFLKGDWDKFRPYLKTFNNRDLEMLHGPECCLSEIAAKKGKRRSITLVRKMD
jgi:hypothetical protein